MKKNILIVIPFHSLAHSIKRVIEHLVPSSEVKIYPALLDKKINTINLIKNLKEIEKYDLLILTSCLSDSSDNNEGFKLAEILDKRFGNLKILILSFAINTLKAHSENISSISVPFNLGKLLSVIFCLLDKELKKDTPILPLKFHKNFNELLHLLSHDFINVYSINCDFFKEIYLLHKEWLNKIFKIDEKQKSVFEENKFKLALKRFEEKTDNGKSLMSYFQSLKNVNISEKKASSINEKNKIFSLFVENTSEITNKIGKDKKSLFRMKEKERANFSRIGALNFWLCWWMWKEFNFLEEFRLYFEKLFFKGSLYTIFTFIKDEEFFDIRYKSKFLIENWYQFISLIKEKLDFISHSYKSMIDIN